MVIGVCPGGAQGQLGSLDSFGRLLGVASMGSFERGMRIISGCLSVHLYALWGERPGSR